MVGHDRLYPRPDSLVTFLGLHDVERFMNVNGATVDGLKLAFTFLMTARGTPLIYYGDEIAMRGGNDPDNRRDFPPTAFDASGRTPEQESVWQHVRKLARLRASTEALRRGRMTDLYADDRVYAYSRTAKGVTGVIVLNNGSQPASVEFAVPGIETATLKDALHEGGTAQVTAGRMTVSLPPRAAAIYF
jgi:glycosidase